MKPHKTIERLLRQLQYKSSPGEFDRVRMPIDEAWQRHEARQRALLLSRRSVKVFGARPVRLVAAAVILLIGLVVSIRLLDRSTNLAYALEQTFEAVKDIRYFHFRYTSPSRQYVDREAWIEYDSHGKLDKVRVNFYGLDSVMVWSGGVTQYWIQDSNELCIFEDQEYTDKILLFAGRFDPKHAVEYLRQRAEQGGIEIQIGEPNEPAGPIPVIVAYEPNTYVIGSPKPPMRDILHIDPVSKLVLYVEGYHQENGDFVCHGVWEYLDYNQPFESGIFDLQAEVPTDTTRFNTLGLDLGVEQGQMSDRQISIKVVEEFFAAWKAKDYDRAVRIHGYTNPGNRKNVLRMLKRFDLLRVLEISEPSAPERPMRGFSLLCRLLINQNGTTRESKWNVLVRKSSATRWRIGKVSPGSLAE